MRITKDLYGSNDWRGSNNTLDWWSLSRLSVSQEDAPQYTLAAQPGQGAAPPLTRNSASLMLPPLEGTWAAGKGACTRALLGRLQCGATRSCTCTPAGGKRQHMQPALACPCPAAPDPQAPPAPFMPIM